MKMMLSLLLEKGEKDAAGAFILSVHKVLNEEEWQTILAFFLHGINVGVALQP